MYRHFFPLILLTLLTLCFITVCDCLHGPPSDAIKAWLARTAADNDEAGILLPLSITGSAVLALYYLMTFCLATGVQKCNHYPCSLFK